MDRVLFAPRALPPLPPDVSEDPERYTGWIRKQAERPPPTRSASRLALLMVVDRDPGGLGRTLAGLAGQTSRNWSLTIAAAADWAAAVDVAVAAAPRRVRRRTRILRSGGSAASLLHHALEPHRDDAVAVVFPGDFWPPAGVSSLTACLGEKSVVYADEDVLSVDGRYGAPRLKPDYSPDFLLSWNYIGRPLAIGAALSRQMPALDVSTEALEHAWALAACGLAASVVHLPRVLCHRWRAPDSEGSSGRHVEDELARRGVRLPVTTGPVTGTYRVQHPDSPSVTVSAVIPFRDDPRLLRTCVETVTATTAPGEVEFVLVDNGSSDPETQTLLDALGQRPGVRVLHDDAPFNWARLSNAGARAATGGVLLFLNNDIEASHRGWLTALRAQAIRPDVGAVGARLLYPDRRVQHCGIVVGLTGAAGHPLAGLPADRPGYLGMAILSRECSAVTGACLATRREVFAQLDGFDERLGVDHNDVDYCLRAWDAGFRVVYEPAAELVHHESPSRGTAGGVGDIVRFLERWEHYIRAGDPYLNPQLTRADASCSLAGDDEGAAWNRWHSIMTAQ